MPTLVERDHVVPLLLDQFDAVAELCGGLSEAQWNKPTCLPAWTVKDVLSHLYGTEAMLLGEKPPEGPKPAGDHIKNATGEFNELWVEGLRPVPGAEVLGRFTEAAERRKSELQAMGQEDMDKPSWTPVGPDETYGRFMRIRHMDLFLHELDIRDALGIPERESSEHVALALEEPEAALGYIVGKRAGMPEGSQVKIELTGPGARTWFVAVTDRARQVEALDGDPTVGISLLSSTFLRLAGGRLPADAVTDSVSVIGDPALAQQLAAGLAYMI